MRVEVTTIEDFCAELDAEAAAGRVHEGIVRVRIDRTPEQEEAISYEVGLWATALIRSADGDYVLEFGRLSGRDTQSDPDAGSSVARSWRDDVLRVCEGHDLRLRRGKIEVW